MIKKISGQKKTRCIIFLDVFFLGLKPFCASHHYYIAQVIDMNPFILCKHVSNDMDIHRLSKKRKNLNI
jgi:hypothetical protein